jgi:hypothetical protein
MRILLAIAMVSTWVISPIISKCIKYDYTFAIASCKSRHSNIHDVLAFSLAKSVFFTTSLTSCSMLSTLFISKRAIDLSPRPAPVEFLRLPPGGYDQSPRANRFR